jgi:hypothetical protein
MWTIHELNNTVNVSNECSHELNKYYSENIIGDEEYDGESPYVSEGGKIYFHDHDMEWMDYISNLEVQEILCKHKTIGVVGFGDFEGDNRGEMWGYKFDGKGGMEKLTGKIMWTTQDGVMSIV